MALAHVAMGIGLASCAGLRAFLPLFAVSLAGKLDLVPLSESFSWMAGWPALIAFGVAVVIELLGDKFPIVDNFLDSVQFFVKPIAGAFVTATVVQDWAPLYVTVLSIAGGATAAGLVHAAKANLRLASSVTTAGLGNPVLSVIEDAGAAAGSVVAIAVPFVAVAILLLLLLLAWIAWTRLRSPA